MKNMSLKLNTGTCYLLKKMECQELKHSEVEIFWLLFVLNVTKDRRMQKWHQDA